MPFHNQILKKQQEVQNRISEINQQISLANADDTKIKAKKNEYTTMIQNLENINDKINDRLKARNAIPILLNQIMSIIPENVQITSIQNTSEKHIEIIAQSDMYDQLGYFIGEIKSGDILKNVIPSSGQKENNIVTVKIEGDLP